MLNTLISLLRSKLFLLKAGSISVTALTGISQLVILPKVISQTELAFFYALMGLATFIVFFDAGLLRGVYVHLRPAFLNKDNSLSKALLNISKRYLIIISLCVFSWIAVSYIFLMKKFQINEGWLLLFAITLFFSALIIMCRPLANAQDRYIKFELCEFFRRSLSLSFPILIFFASALFAVSIQLLGIMALLLVTLIICFPKLKVVQSDPTLLRKKIRNDRNNSMIFIMCEVFIHNIIYLIGPLFFGIQDNIYLSYCMRIYLLGVVFIRVSGDIFIHKFTECFKMDDSTSITKVYKDSMVVAILFAVLSILAAAILFFYLNLFVSEEVFTLDLNALTFLIIMFTSAAFLHIPGTYLSSYSHGLRLVRSISSSFAITIIILTVVLSGFVSIKLILILFSLMHLLLAFSVHATFLREMKQRQLMFI